MHPLQEILLPFILQLWEFLRVMMVSSTLTHTAQSDLSAGMNSSNPVILAQRDLVGMYDTWTISQKPELKHFTTWYWDMRAGPLYRTDCQTQCISVRLSSVKTGRGGIHCFNRKQARARDEAWHRLLLQLRELLAWNIRNLEDVYFWGIYSLI